MAEGNYNFTSLQPHDEEPLQEIHYVEDDEEEEKTAEQEPLQDIQCNTRKFHHNKILLETRFSFIF
jgi:hypothetical protein